MKRIALLVPLLMIPVSAGAQTLERDEQIQALLNRRAEAVMAKDQTLFLTTVDPNAKEFLAAQSRWFDRIVTLPLAEYTLELAIDENGEFTREKDAGRYGASVLVTSVEERIRLEGFDATASLSVLHLTFVQREGGWLVASDSDLDDLGFYSSRHLWDFGDIRIATSAHFLLVFHPEEARFATELLDGAEAALADVERAWARPWSQKVPIMVPTTRQELERMLGATFDVSDFVAFAVASVDSDEGYVPAGPRIFLNRANFLRHSAGSRRAIFAHELLHVATRPSSGPFVPVWLEEGLAQLTESSGTPDLTAFMRRVRGGKFDGKLPADLEFVSGGGDEIFATYQEALSAVSYLRDRFGLEKLNAFYERFGGARIEPGTADYHADSAMREVLGLSLEQFQTEWAAAVQG